MKTYKILVSGSGSETYLFELDKERYDILHSLDFEDSEINFTLAQIGYSDLGDANQILTGPYLDSIAIKVFNDWDLPISKIMRNYESDENNYLYTNLLGIDHLVYENLVSGEFFSVEIKIPDDQDFESSKLDYIVMRTGVKEIVVGFKYDDKELTLNYLDYISTDSQVYVIKGFEE